MRDFGICLCLLREVCLSLLRVGLALSAMAMDAQKFVHLSKHVHFSQVRAVAYLSNKSSVHALSAIVL